MSNWQRRTLVAMVVAIAQTTLILQPALVYAALRRLPEYRDSSYYGEPDSGGTVRDDAPVLAPELAPVPVSDALQNLRENYNVPLPLDNGAFDADAPLLRRDYITYMVPAFDALQTQYANRLAEGSEQLDNACFTLEIALNYLTGRVERLQEDMERIQTTSHRSSNKSTRLEANDSIPFTKNTEGSIQENPPVALVETPLHYYSYWFYTLAPRLIATILPNHQQPLTQGEFVGYVSPTLDGLNEMLTLHADNHLQNSQYAVDQAEFELNAIFDQVARVRGQLATLANSKQLRLSMPQRQGQATQTWADELPDTLGNTTPRSSDRHLALKATLLPQWRNAIPQDLFAQVHPIENFPDVPPSDPLYDALWRTVNTHGIAFPPPNDYIDRPSYRDVENIYPDDALTIGDFAYYQHQWVARTMELVLHGGLLYHLEQVCGSELETAFIEETAMMEDTLRTMESELQQLIDHR